jgi:uncharacterized membrane protein
MKPEKENISEKEKRLAAFAYLFGFLSGITVLSIEKKSHFVRFHGMQSVTTFIVLFLLTVFLELVPVVGPVLGALLLLCSGIFGLYLISKAIKGTYYKVPYLGEFVEKKM